MRPANGIRVVGFDPSMNNWGVSKGLLDLGTMELVLAHVDVIQPDLPTGKQVRQNSKDLEASVQLSTAVLAHAKGAQAIFVEVPVGSQNARAALGCGLCIGILGALRAMDIPFIEVTATEVKMAGFGNKNATKKQMISWAMKQHPEANWPMQTQLGVTTPVESKAEHMADATAAIYAGLQTNSFKQSLHLMQFQSAA